MNTNSKLYKIVREHNTLEIHQQINIVLQRNKTTFLKVNIPTSVDSD